MSPATLVAQATPDLDTMTALAQTPFWVTLIKCLVVFVALILLTLFTTFFERRVIASLQQRIGPNRVGPKGLLQAFADGIKLAFKQGITPRSADVWVYLLAPMIAATTAFLTFAVIPMGPQVDMFGVTTPLQITDFPVSVLFVFAVASVGIYGIVLAGWASGSTYSLLGGLRSSAQMISYEVAMGLSFVAVFLYAGSMSTSQIVDGQVSTWYIVLLLPSFIIYVISMVGETNRAPFDLPEAEGELVAGFMTEYSGLRWAMFFLAEYIAMINVSAIATTLFLGGWRAPAPISTVWPGSNEGYWPLIWFMAKVFVFLFVFVWLRGSLPRMRYDQFMRLGWRVLIPVGLAWIIVVAALRVVRNQYSLDTRTIFIALGAVLVVIAVAMMVVDMVRGEPEAAPEEPKFDPYAGGFPVPPLPGQELEFTPRARRVMAASTTGDGASGTATLVVTDATPEAPGPEQEAAHTQDPAEEDPNG
jgi:NADH-quinone oxidoreductase subunit H